MGINKCYFSQKKTHFSIQKVKNIRDILLGFAAVPPSPLPLQQLFTTPFDAKQIRLPPPLPNPHPFSGWNIERVIKKEIGLIWEWCHIIVLTQTWPIYFFFFGINFELATKIVTFLILKQLKEKSDSSGLVKKLVSTINWERGYRCWWNIEWQRPSNIVRLFQKIFYKFLERHNFVINNRSKCTKISNLLVSIYSQGKWCDLSPLKF